MLLQSVCCFVPLNFPLGGGCWVGMGSTSQTPRSQAGYSKGSLFEEGGKLYIALYSPPPPPSEGKHQGLLWPIETGSSGLASWQGSCCWELSWQTQVWSIWGIYIPHAQVASYSGLGQQGPEHSHPVKATSLLAYHFYSYIPHMWLLGETPIFSSHDKWKHFVNFCIFGVYFKNGLK